MEEPSILDYLKSKLTPWKGPALQIPSDKCQVGKPDLESGKEGIVQETEAPPQAELLSEMQREVRPETSPKSEPVKKQVRVPWRSLLALVLSLLAQYSLSPLFRYRDIERAWKGGVILLVGSIGLLIWATIKAEWAPAPLPEQSLEVDPPRMNLKYLLVGCPLAMIAFLSFGELNFTLLNLALLLLTLFLVILAFWPPHHHDQQSNSLNTLLSRIKSGEGWSLTFNISTLTTLAAIAWVLFFRFYRIAQVPPEMNSDHAEKILDILRVLAGQTSIFFPANGGREPLIFYLDAALHLLFKLPLDFTTLKLVSATIGFLSLPFIYLCGKELGNRRVGFLAFLFAGIAYWPNVVSRFGLRLPFYILFSAIIFYLLLRGIRTSRRDYFIYAGIALGLSLYGYSADRILPMLVLLAVGLYLIHPHSRNRRQFILASTVALVFVSLILFLPLLRYIISEPDSFLFRTLTRMGERERPLPGPAWQIFLNNVGRALAMVAWDNGEIWPISIPDYPALSIVAGALFYIGAGLLLIRYIQKRHWLDLFMLLSIPVLMLPSTLSLAFPAENPNLYRTGGALVPIFLIIAIALDGLMTSLSSRIPYQWGKWSAWILALLLFGWSSLQDYHLVFDQFFIQYQRSAWNTSEMGSVAHGFSTTIGSPDTVWVMGFPHWVDTRLVAINSGYPGKDYELFVNEIENIKTDQRAKMFLLNPADEAAIAALKQRFPQGQLQPYVSKVETKDFLIYFVPPQSDN